MPRAIASLSAARKNQRSKSSSKRRRSSWDLAIVVASASRKSSREVQGTSSNAAKASRISEVPTATPSLRSSSQKPSSFAACPGGPASALGPYGLGKLHPDSLGNQIDVGAVLDDDRHRLVEGLAVDVLGSHQQQRARPIDRLGDRGRLLQVEVADHPHHLDQLAGQRLGELGSVQADDLHLTLELWVIEPEIEAASLQRLGQLTRVVRGEDHNRHRRRRYLAQLGDRDLEVGQELEEHRLELLVGLVDLVDQQDDRLLGRDRAHQRPLEQELLAEDVVLHLLPARALGLRLDAQELLAVVPLVERLGLVEPLVALQAHEGAIEVLRQRAGELGLADAGRALDEDRLAEFGGQVRDERGRLAGEVADGAQARGDVVDARGGGGHGPRMIGTAAWVPRCSRRSSTTRAPSSVRIRSRSS